MAFSSRPGSRMASRPGSPALHRKQSVSKGVVDMLEGQLDGLHVDAEYDMEGHVQVEVPIDEDFTAAAGAQGPARPSRASINDFDVLTMIGKGGYGKVYLVRHKTTQRHYAMKVLRKASILLQKRQITFTMTERSILSEVQHPFIVKLYYAFQSNSKLYLILEYVAGGELFTHMARERIFSEDQAVFYTAELVLALSHLHKLGIVFRDAKPENCLLSNTGHLVLTDFGLSKTALGADGRTSTFCGTPSYMAPEVLDSSESYEFSVDWWSLGILLYEMLTGAVPFKGKQPKQILKNIAKMKVNYPNYLTPDAKDLLIRLLRKKPAQRLGYGSKGSEDIKKHRFFRKVDWQALEKNYHQITPPIVPVVQYDGDFSNFDTEFTNEDVPPSVANGSLIDNDPLPDPAKLDVPNDNTADQKNDKPDDIDPATAFLGFSYVATSVLHTVN
ncbi:Pkinase-domain-containing protein [Linderina pennispora]|uniref:non-specific serine/threonine protein kinase n=1 Tax=Linderina pennispora TaxID=61395 RepID=A0A1Y1WI09_9FUNG|nr:Pkinase-domain-containing protein [Linderina pennispora]ORX73210.1 Pkinase-domain-containing protein [Linderina pennispora]